MGYIKEPKGVDLLIGPSPFTDKDKQMISEIIANYKRTGKRPAKAKKDASGRSAKRKRNTKTLA